MSFYVLWYTNEVDGILRDAAGHVVSRRDIDELRVLASDIGIELSPEGPAVYDFDSLGEVLALNPRRSKECNTLLEAWNLLDDAITPVDDGGCLHRKSRESAAVYEKLFWASNIPALTPPDKEFLPEWSEAETRQIVEVLQAGTRGLRRLLGLG
jgi:hypothetical protein